MSCPGQSFNEESNRTPPPPQAGCCYCSNSPSSLTDSSSSFDGAVSFCFSLTWPAFRTLSSKANWGFSKNGGWAVRVLFNLVYCVCVKWHTFGFSDTNIDMSAPIMWTEGCCWNFPNIFLKWKLYSGLPVKQWRVVRFVGMFFTFLHSLINKVYLPTLLNKSINKSLVKFFIAFF